MGKKLLNIIEIFLILVIVLVCFVSLLQSKFIQNKSIFGYHTYVVSSDIKSQLLEYGDIILVKEIEFDEIDKNDVITYIGKEGKIKDKIITNKVTDITKQDNITVLKINDEENSYVYKEQLLGEYTHKFILISAISKIIIDKVGFVVCLLIPFSILLILELINIEKETKRKKIKDTMKFQLEELQNIDDNSELTKTIKENIQSQIKEIQEAKRDFKKIDKLEETIQIPLEEIQKQIIDLNKKLSNETKEEDKVGANTELLFTKDDIKEVIKKDLETKKIVDNKKIENDKVTKQVKNKNHNKNKKTTAVVVKK